MLLDKLKGLRALAAGALLAASLAPSAMAAESPQDFYKGKTVKILVGSPPGGGYDVYARMLAPHIAERLGAEVIVENRPGGGGLLALSMLSTARPDGLTLMHASAEGAIMSQLVDREGARWDVEKLNWLARTAEESKVLFFSTKSKLKTLDDAIKADKVLWSATGPADNISDVEAIISHVLGLKSEIVTGYKGAKDMSLAVVNGEVDAGVLSETSAAKLIEGGQLKGIAVIDRQRSKLLPDLPTIFELADLPPEKAWWIDFRTDIGKAQRAMVTSPGVPQDRVEYLRQVMNDVLTDPKVIEEGKKADLAIGYLPGAEIQALIAKTLESVAGDRLPEIKKVMLETYL